MIKNIPGIPLVKKKRIVPYRHRGFFVEIAKKTTLCKGDRDAGRGCGVDGLNNEFGPVAGGIPAAR